MSLHTEFEFDYAPRYIHPPRPNIRSSSTSHKTLKRNNSLKYFIIVRLSCILNFIFLLCYKAEL